MGKTGTKLGLDGTYIPRSYIEQVHRTLTGILFASQLQQPDSATMRGRGYRQACVCAGVQVQLEKLTEAFQTVTEDLKRRFAVNGESVVDETNISGSSPMSAGHSPFRSNSLSGGAFASQRGFSVGRRPSMASSGGAQPSLTFPLRRHMILRGASRRDLYSRSDV